mmetsp:Transcript_71574/g.141920  ORF Transcript_71574/g.141920 Transcript_71574/m.141920 type:complete len:115 (-) Transcript_71574:376-720(-)
MCNRRNAPGLEQNQLTFLVLTAFIASALAHEHASITSSNCTRRTAVNGRCSISRILTMRCLIVLTGLSSTKEARAATMLSATNLSAAEDELSCAALVTLLARFVIVKRACFAYP